MGIEALPVGLQVREVGQLTTLRQQIHQEGVHDVGAGEAIPHQIVAIRQYLIEVAQHLGTLRLGVVRQEAHRAAILAHEHVEQQRQDAGALGKVKPLQIFGILRAIWCRCQPIRGMAGNQVLGDGARFRQHPAVELDDWRLAEGVDGLELGRRQKGGGIALVSLDLIGQAQLFEQPDDALGAGFVQVVQDYHNDLDSVAGRCVRTGEGGGSPAVKKSGLDARSLVD